MVIFNSYVSLPEGIPMLGNLHLEPSFDMNEWNGATKSFLGVAGHTTMGEVKR